MLWAAWHIRAPCCLKLWLINATNCHMPCLYFPNATIFRKHSGTPAKKAWCAAKHLIVYNSSHWHQTQQADRHHVSQCFSTTVAVKWQKENIKTTVDKTQGNAFGILIADHTFINPVLNLHSTPLHFNECCDRFNFKSLRDFISISF